MAAENNENIWNSQRLPKPPEAWVETNVLIIDIQIDTSPPPPPYLVSRDVSPQGYEVIWSAITYLSVTSKGKITQENFTCAEPNVT